MSVSVLLVEDHEPSRAMLSERLRLRGFEDWTPIDGRHAVAAALEHRPDIILMDLSLPSLDGVEAWRTICDMCDEPPPAIAMTACTIQDVQSMCAELGFSAYVTKPCVFSELVSEINRLVLRAPHLNIS